MPNNRRIWITGASGQIGTAIFNLLNHEYYELLTTDTDIEVENIDSITRFADMNRPDVIINCAGITNVQECENNTIQAFRVNALGARNISTVSRKINAKIIHLSTDDVFGESEKKILTEFDTPHPTTVYGKSKLAGEMFVRELAPKHVVVRSSWVYGKNGKNFVTDILNQAKISNSLRVANDQIGSPTSAIELARFIRCLIDSNEYGIYHASCDGFCSRYEFAKKILTLAGLENIELQGFSSEKDEIIYERPRYSLIQNLMMDMTQIYKMSSWENSLQEFMKNI